MNTSRESRLETIGAMKAMIEMPSVSKVDQQMKAVIMPQFIAVLEDCNELEDKVNEMLAEAKKAEDLLGEWRTAMDEWRAAMKKAEAE